MEDENVLEFTNAWRFDVETVGRATDQNSLPDRLPSHGRQADIPLLNATSGGYCPVIPTLPPPRAASMPQIHLVPTRLFFVCSPAILRRGLSERLRHDRFSLPIRRTYEIIVGCFGAAVKTYL